MHKAFWVQESSHVFKVTSTHSWEEGSRRRLSKDLEVKNWKKALQVVDIYLKGTFKTSRCIVPNFHLGTSLCSDTPYFWPFSPGHLPMFRHPLFGCPLCFDTHMHLDTPLMPQMSPYFQTPPCMSLGVGI